MTQKKEIAAVEARARALRMTLRDVCAEAGLHNSSWSRAKSRGTISIKNLGRMEDALARLEAAKVS